MHRTWLWIDRLEGGMASLGAGLCLLAILGITLLGVFGRYVLGTDLVPGGYNIIERVAFPLLVFWAVPMAHREGSFPRFELLSERGSPALRRAVDAFVLAVELAVFAVVFVYVCRFAWDAATTGRAIQIGTELWPAGPVIAMIPLAFGLMLLEVGRQLWETLRGNGRRDPGGSTRPATGDGLD